VVLINLGNFCRDLLIAQRTCARHDACTSIARILSNSWTS